MRNGTLEAGFDMSGTVWEPSRDYQGKAGALISRAGDPGKCQDVALQISYFCWGKLL